MKFKGTNGLKILESNQIGFGLGVDNDNIKLTIWGNNEESKANALLISKTPKMLNFMQSMVSDYENGLIDDIEDLITKAEQLVKEATEL